MRTLALVFVSILAGCAAQAAGPSASVDVNALVRSHPMYGTLAQYDRQIAALRATLNVPEFARKDQAFSNAANAVRSTLEQTATRTRQLAAMPSPDVRNLQSSASVSAPSESRVRSDMQQRYDAQSAQLQAAAKRDMDRYRSQVLAQQDAALASYERAMRERVQQAYTSREQQFYEKESTLALDLAKTDAAKRLAIRAKLQTLMLSDARRRKLQAQMDAIGAREDAVVAQQHRRDQAQLAAFLPPLQARADADTARMRADLQTRTAANLASRERVLAAQNATAMHRLNLGATARPASSSTDMRGQLDSLLGAQPADPAAFLHARDDLSTQFAGVQNADRDATRSTQAEIATLERDRSQLYNDMVSQIMRDAQSVARARGLAQAYPAGHAPAGSTDITPAVRSDFASLVH